MESLVSSGKKNADRIKIIFTCKCNSTTFGQKLYVVGNIQTLGHWEASKSLVLTTNPNDFPLWKASQTIEVKNGTQIQYKYMCSSDDFKDINWESFHGNRVLNIKKKLGAKNSMMIIQDEYSKFSGTNVSWVPAADCEDVEEDVMKNPGRIEVSPQFKPRELKTPPGSGSQGLGQPR